jgi:hypothetical protein
MKYFIARGPEGRVFKRSSLRHVYSHCVIVHRVWRPMSEAEIADFGTAAAEAGEGWGAAWASSLERAQRAARSNAVEGWRSTATAYVVPVEEIGATQFRRIKQGVTS